MTAAAEHRAILRGVNAPVGSDGNLENSVLFFAHCNADEHAFDLPRDRGEAFELVVAYAEPLLHFARYCDDRSAVICEVVDRAVNLLL